MPDTNLGSFSLLKGLKGLKIVHLNCCSMINKIDEIRQVLVGESDVDVLCLTETNITMIQTCLPFPIIFCTD